jgi:hypothetical protein
VLSIFNDAYAGLGDARLASYVSSWVDSAPNQLSLLAPFEQLSRFAHSVCASMAQAWSIVVPPVPPPPVPPTRPSRRP